MTVSVRARARKRIPGTPIILNFSRSGLSWSLKAGRATYNHRRKSLSVDTPGIGSVMFTPTKGARTTKAVAPALLPEDVAIARTCPKCGSEPGDVCRTPTTRKPAAAMHRDRRIPTPPPPVRHSLPWRIAYGVGYALTKLGKGLIVCALLFPVPTLVVVAVLGGFAWSRLT